MRRPTRLVLIAPNGARIERAGEVDIGHLLGVDLTAIPNADASAPIYGQVEQQCDLGHWHKTGAIPLPCYDIGRPE